MWDKNYANMNTGIFLKLKIVNCVQSSYVQISTAQFPVIITAELEPQVSKWHQNGEIH